MWIERRKYPDSPHWWHEAEPVGSDEIGDWFECGAGTPFHQVDRVVMSSCPSRILVPHAGWWMARYLAGHVALDLYVDVVGPREVVGDRIVMIDYDLDVIRRCDGRAPRVQLIDEDEFALHSIKLGYSDEAVDQARAAATWIVEAVQAEAPPFDPATFAACGVTVSQ